MSITHIILLVIALVLVIYGAITLINGGGLILGLVLLGAGLLVFFAANGSLRL